MDHNKINAAVGDDAESDARVLAALRFRHNFRSGVGQASMALIVNAVAVLLLERKD